MEDADSVQSKYDIFVKYFTEGVLKYVAKYRSSTRKEKEWFTRQCETARLRKEDAWNKTRNKNTRRNREAFKVARNSYVQARREAQRKYEKYIVDKCINEPKLFYRFINGKMKQKVGISRLKVEDEVYEDDDSICEIMNQKFQEVFTRESQFERISEDREVTGLGEIQVEKKKILDRLSKLDGRKAVGPDGTAGIILRE